MKNFTNLLNKYYLSRLELNNALSEYKEMKSKCRYYLKAENQKENDLLKFGYENNLHLDEIVYEWNENVIPCLTQEHMKEKRRMNEFKCRQSKKKIKECQIKFNQVCQEINNYLLHDKYKRNSRRQFKYLLNKMGIRFHR